MNQKPDELQKALEGYSWRDERDGETLELKVVDPEFLEDSDWPIVNKMLEAFKTDGPNAVWHLRGELGITDSAAAYRIWWAFYKEKIFKHSSSELRENVHEYVRRRAKKLQERDRRLDEIEEKLRHQTAPNYH